MSDIVSALNEATFNGYCTVREAGLRGMITLRGDLASTEVKNAATGVAGVDMPGPRECNCVGEKGIAWMSPDELLILTGHTDAASDLAKIEKTLKGTHYLAQNVSDARAVFVIEGANVREVLAKLAPVDMSPEAFPLGHFRRTRLAQVAAAFWMRDEETAELICFRSGAAYVYNILKDAATPGSEVGAI